MDIYFTMAIVIYLYRTQLYDCATFHLAIVVVLVVIAHYSAGFHSATVPTVILQLIYIESHGSMVKKPYSCQSALKIFCDMNVFTFHIFPMWLPITHIA